MYDTVIKRIATYAGDRAEKIAIMIKDQGITYGELYKNVCGFCEYLLQNGIQKGNYVIIRSTFTLAHWVAFFGVQLAGGVIVPLEKDVTSERIQEISDRVGGAFAIISNSKEQSLSDKLFIDIENVFSIAKENYIDGKEYEFPLAADDGFVLFTTGTTGKAKGVVIAHEYMVHAAYATEIPYGEDTVMILPAPPNHVLCIGRGTACLAHGGTAIIMDGLSDLAEFYRALSDHGANAMTLTPSALNFITMLTGDEFKKYDKQIKFIESGGEKMLRAQQESLKELLPSVRIFIMYASTETGTGAYYEFSKYGATDNRIGKPATDSEVLFLDDDWQEVEASKENPAYISIRSKHLMKGYLNDPETTASVMRDDCIKMSDYGYIDEDGFVCLTGRAGDVIISGGQKINPAEVENVAMETGLLTECVCIGRADAVFGKLVTLLVVMKPNVPYDEVAIKEYMVDHLESFKVPKYIEQVDKVIRNKNGKIDRKSYNQ